MTTNTDPAKLREFMRAMDPHTIHGALGIETIELSEQRVVMEVDVTERLLQHAGIVHGGVYVVLAESAASTAAALAVDIEKVRVAGQEISASHVRAATSGRLRAETTLVHQGRTSLVYAITVRNDGELVSSCRCTMAVRPRG